MESLPLQKYTVHKWTALIHRSHTIVHSIALIAMIYYRLASFLYHIDNISIPLIPWLLIFASELLLAFLWLLSSAYGWRPISRTVYPERLPPDDELPAIDVFICTADPKKEPPLEVMNTVISAMALDYPPEKLSVYLSDDGSSSLTLFAIQEAWSFANSWVRFCRRYKIKTRCPEAYFSALDHDHGGGREFEEVREKIEREYWQFKEHLKVASEKEEIKNTGGAKHGQSHPPTIQKIGDRGSDSFTEMPFLVYVSREKKPYYPHHFKAGALNVLLRVSATMSNSPYILVLDCDFYSNDSSSARQAMCFHLDQKISPSLAFVQFPQKFHNVSKNDIYGASLRSAFEGCPDHVAGYGRATRTSAICGTGFYMKRKVLYGIDIDKDSDLTLLRKSFGPSNEFIKSLNSYGNKHGTIKYEDLIDTLLEEAKFVASCIYEDDTQWGKQIGFLYDSVVEDYFTGFVLHCRGWISVLCNPSKPAFMGSATTNLSETLVQGTRWNYGLLEVFLSRMCPLIYGFPRMPLLECMCYAYLAAQPLYFFPMWCLGIVPQLCLLKGIPIYPKVSSRWFIIYSFVFISPLAKFLLDVLRTGGTFQSWWNEWRVWMIKSITAYFYGSFDAILKLFGIAEARFIPTNKVADDEQLKRYQMDIFDFQASTMLLAPLVTLVILNMVSFIQGTALVIIEGQCKQLFGQIFLSLFILIVNYPILEGMLFRKDKGSIPLHVTLLSAAFSLTILSLNAFHFH